jgi:nucleoid-associated protein YejK
MKNPAKITILKLIVHILNTKRDEPKLVLSDTHCNLTDHLTEFFVSHIQKSLADDKARVAKFSGPDGAVKRLTNEILDHEGRFVQNSRKLAELLFTPMRQNRAISGGDMVVCIYAADNLPGRFLGIFKMDLAEAFRHKVGTEKGRTSIQITPLSDVLPSPSQKLQKCVFIRPPKPQHEYEMVILDNQIGHLSDHPGVANFFCKTFLECTLSQSDRDKTKLFQTSTRKWVEAKEKEGRLDQAEAESIRDAARQEIRRPDPVNISEFARVVINDPALRENFQQTLREEKLEDAEFVPDQQYAQKTTAKKKYLADHGITVSGDAVHFDEVVNVNWEPDAENRLTVTIKTTKWTQQI